MTQFVDELGIETRYRYDAQGNLMERIEAANRPGSRTTTWTYDPWGQRLSETVGTGTDAAIRRWQYDDFGNVSAQTDALGQIERYTYNVQGQALTWQAVDGAMWKADYEAHGWLTQRQDPLGHRRITTYDALGRRAKVTDPTGAITTYEYDPTGRLLAQTNALGQTTRYTYDEQGRLISTTDPAGNSTRMTYDGQGRVSSVTDPAENTTRYRYGDQSDGLEGLVAAILYPTYRVEYRYDARDRPTQTIQVLDSATTRTTQLVYNSKGQRVSRTEPGGQVTLSDYDELGRLSRTTDALGGVTS